MMKSKEKDMYMVKNKIADTTNLQLEIYKAKNRIDWIDLAKGIAIVCVVIGHVVASYHETGLYENNTWWNFSHQYVYSFHMPLFMILSGILFSMSKKNSNKKTQVFQKLVNYGIPYVIFSTLWIFTKVILSSMTNNTVSIKELLWIGIYPVSFMWYLYALLLMQIIQILVDNFTNTKTIKVIHLIWAGGGYLIQPYINEILSRYKFSDCILSDFLRFYIFYLIGVYGSQYIMKKKRSIHLVACSGFIFFTSNVLLFFYGDIVVGINRKIVDFVVAITGCILWVEICKQVQGFKTGGLDLIKFLGKESFPIYVLQGFAIAATRILMTKFGLNDVFGIIPMFVCTVFGCALPLAAYYISTKIWKLDGLFYPGRYIKF